MVEISPLVIRAFLESKFFVGIATAGVIVAAGIIAAHFLCRFIAIMLLKFGWKEKFQKYGIKNPAAAIESILNYLIYAIAFIAALYRLGIFNIVFGLIGIAIIGLIVVAAYLEFRDAVANFFAYFHIRKLNLKVGEIIKISDVQGKIQSIGVLEVKLVTEKNDTIIIPNRFFLKSKLERKHV